MRILIVITVPPAEYKLWSLTEEWHPEEKFEQTPVRSATAGPDKILVLCQAQSTRKYERDATLEIRSVTTPWVSDLANSEINSRAEKVYVAAHDSYVNLRDLPLKITDNRYAAGAYFHHEVSQPDSKLFEHLVALFTGPSQNKFDTVLESIEQHHELSWQQRLATLRYQLAHVFLPVTIDLHAWREVDFDDDHMQEILNASVDGEERMDRARSIVYEQPAFAGMDTIEKLVKEAELESSSHWRNIESLLPRRDPRFFQSRDQPPFSILDSFQDKEKLKALRTRLLENNELFAEWSTQLDSALAELAAQID
jgi:hypothetical protein